MKNKKIIRCDKIGYRQGFIEIRSGIHDRCINIETWEINPELNITSHELTDEAITDDDVVSNTEIELNLENAEQLVSLLQEAISEVKSNEST